MLKTTLTQLQLTTHSKSIKHANGLFVLHMQGFPVIKNNGEFLSPETTYALLAEIGFTTVDGEVWENQELVNEIWGIDK